MTRRLVLDRTPPAPAAPPVLDEAQRRVVQHRTGPLLVLAGPGTGKTTTVVEAVAGRLAAAPGQLGADEVLVLTFGRAAAAEVRDRIVARLGGGVVPQVATFHSFAYALVRSFSDPALFADPLRLLSGPEQESRLRELFRFAVADGRVRWPADLAEALGTRGLAAEVRAVVSALRGHGLDPDQLVGLGAASGNAAWEAVGEFAGEYLDVLDAEGVLDYTELVLRAVLVAEQPDVSAVLRRRYKAVFVDEYQDTDPMQVRLLQALVTPATSLVVVGDPDQAIYSFRGADLRGILRFRAQFRAADGSEAGTVVLATTRRFGPVLRAAATRVLGPRLPAGIPSDLLRAHRQPSCAEGPFGPGIVQVRTYDDEGAQAAHVAELVKRAVLDSRREGSAALPLRWSDVAVLVRSGAALAVLQRTLLGAGVPVQVAGDEVPLQAEPAVGAVVAAARVVARSDLLAPDTAEALLLSPLVGLDPADLRRLARALRRAEREAGEAEGVRPRPSMLLVAESVADPRVLLSVQEGRAREGVAAVRRLSRLLAQARGVLETGGTPHDVVWAVVSGTRWTERLRAAALAGGPGARLAHRDLDALGALVDVAERYVLRRGGVGSLLGFLDEVAGHEVPGETHAQRGLAGDAVQLLTAHRSKGLQWPFVVVAGVQEGAWPDLRRRGSVLQADRIGPRGLVDPVPAGALLAEERRLFYVACTRAQGRLVVTAVASRRDDGDEPSRFLADLGVEPVHVAGRPTRPLSPAGLVGDLRRACVDPALPEAVRAAAARRLAVLAAVRDSAGRPLVPAAEPAAWWGTRDVTEGPQPVRPPDLPIRLSGSAVEGLLDCPLQWFLQREVHADTPRGTATGFGSLLHALADHVARGELPADLDVLDEVLEGVWGQLGFEAAWQSGRERAAARAALARFLEWHGARTGTLVATEHTFVVDLDLVHADGEPVTVTVRGSIDVLDGEVVDGAAVVRVHDLKTGRAVPSNARVGAHVQLGIYQTAVAAGGADEVVRAALGTPEHLAVRPGGASLVQLRHDAPRGAPGPKVQQQAAVEPVDDEATWVEAALADAAAVVRGEHFEPRRGRACEYCDFVLACPAMPLGQPVVR